MTLGAAMHGALVQPFIEFGFMRRALVACLALGLSCGPVGTLLCVHSEAERDGEAVAVDRFFAGACSPTRDHT